MCVPAVMFYNPLQFVKGLHPSWTISEKSESVLEVQLKVKSFVQYDIPVRIQISRKKVKVLCDFLLYDDGPIQITPSIDPVLDIQTGF